jgi:hypothetical protein
MFAESSVDHAHVEEDLACVANLVELVQSVVEFIVVVPRKGGNPSLDFLEPLSAFHLDKSIMRAIRGVILSRTD